MFTFLSKVHEDLKFMDSIKRENERLRTKLEESQKTLAEKEVLLLEATHSGSNHSLASITKPSD
jgi:hypothetical protein